MGSGVWTMVERDPIYVSPKAGGALKPRDSCFSIENQACSGEVSTPDVIPPQLVYFHKRQKKAWCDDSQS